ncbi:MAG TPA: hypothetical protein VMT51_13935 [Dongiaceae bacterium]|nr:hypothetical protein [Dongiaceae bacterium]
MTASTDENVLQTTAESLGAAAGKVVASAKRTAASLAGEKERLSEGLDEEKVKLAKVASKVRSDARRTIKKTKKKAAKAASTARKKVASAKRSLKRAARRLKRR